MTKQPRRYVTKSGEFLSPRDCRIIDALRKMPKAKRDAWVALIYAEAEQAAKEGGAS